MQCGIMMSALAFLFFYDLSLNEQNYVVENIIRLAK